MHEQQKTEFLCCVDVQTDLDTSAATLCRSELGISKRAKLSRLSLLACNFWHLELACLACLAKTVGLLGLLARLIDFCIEVLGLYTKSRLWPTPRSLLCGPTRSYNAQLRRGGYYEAWQGIKGLQEYTKAKGLGSQIL